MANATIDPDRLVQEQVTDGAHGDKVVEDPNA